MIRTAKVSDIIALAKVHLASWQSAYRCILPDEVLDNLSVEQFQDNWVSNFSNTERINLALEVEGRVSGFISFGNSRDNDSTVNTGEIYGIYLLPELCGLGYGHKLWLEASQYLQERFSMLTLWVLQNNIRARKFYERIGFAEDKQSKYISLYSVELSEVRYRKNL